jgi:predicted N-formylglutamate amidohydrolase
MPRREPALSALISCEHASNAVPACWQHLFRGHSDLLDSHRGFDRGSLEMGQALSRHTGAPLLVGKVTRLLVDLNRSAAHPRHFSEFTRALPAVDRFELDETFWQPHWQRYRQYLDSLPGRIVHVACHSFTPVIQGRTRAADIGLLYDPARAAERAWCRRLADRIREALPGLRVRMNYPYRGTSNGMGQQHRPHYDDRRLVTMELEINQALCDRHDWPVIIRGLSTAVAINVEDSS